MIVNEMAKFAKPPISRNSTCAYPSLWSVRSSSSGRWTLGACELISPPLVDRMGEANSSQRTLQMAGRRCDRVARMLTLDELRADVEAGAVDTVVAAFTDM